MPPGRGRALAVAAGAGVSGGSTVTIPPPAARVGRFSKGQIVAGRYRIERAIKSGGMGEVYLAYDLQLEQRIALKTIKQSIAGDPDAMARLRLEVVLARAVNHPNVCRVFDFYEAVDERTGRKFCFLTMEFLPGESLFDRLRCPGTMDSGKALELIRQMADGLEAAHRAGVIHRDFKPGNVMLTPLSPAGERAVVMDFGLARRRVRDGGLTREGHGLGTPKYAAPEQWRGDDVTPTADLYSLGVVIHELVTGKKPAPGVDESLKDPWARVIRQCLEEEPTARPSSPLEVVSKLEVTPEVTPWNWKLLGRVGATLIVLAAASSAVPGSWFRQPAKVEHKNVVILPIRTSDQELRLFADGLTESITQRLSQYEGPNEELLVTPASETRREKIEFARDAKAKLGANIAVESSLAAQEGRLRLELSVIDTAMMRQIDSTTVEGSRNRAFELQDQAMGNLARLLQLRVRPWQATGQAPMASSAEELILSGRGYLRRSDQLASVRLAVGLFQRAVELDPRNARAHSGLSEARWREFERTNDRELVESAASACRTALSLNSRLAEVNVSCGRVMAGTGKAKEALKYFQAALRLEPRNGEAMEGLGRAFETSGDLAKAETAFQDMVRLRSGDWQAYKQRGLFYYRRGRFEEAAAQFRRVVELTPDNAQGYSNLAVMLAQAGHLEEARRALETSHKIEPRPSNLSNLGKLLFDLGKYGEAGEYHRQAVEKRPASRVDPTPLIPTNPLNWQILITS